MYLAQALLLLFSFFFVGQADAATRRLATDCTYAAGFIPSEATPFDLDWCTLQDNDNIRDLIVDIANKWAGTTTASVYLRAPSKSLKVVSDTVSWATAASKPIKTFVFLEDQDPANKLTIQHAPSNPTAQITLKYACTPTRSGEPAGDIPESVDSRMVMWVFNNYNYIKMGGNHLSMTIIGTHPGLGNAGTRTCGGTPAYVYEINAGLLDLRVDNGSNPELIDIRVNTRDAQAYSVMTGGAQAVNGTANRAQQVNISGVHSNTDGLSLGSGIKNIWFDPDKTVISDPYVRNMGWDGAVSTTVNGRPVGCFDSNRSRGRQNTGPYFVDKMTGGLTIEYGYISFAPRVVNRVGNSVSDPFVIRVKDWGSSGPGTPYPAGVMVKKGWQSIFTKGDPHPAYGNTQAFRYIKYISLPSTYGQGFYGGSLTGCAVGNVTNNNYPDADDNTIRFEANDGVGENFGWDVTFEGDWDKQWRRGQLLLFALEPWSITDRSWGHVLRAGKGMFFKDTTILHDTNTATGEGTYSKIYIRPECLYSGTSYCVNGKIPAKNNTVKDTNVTGDITIDADSGTTIVSNVNFGSVARTILKVAVGTSTDVSKLCVAAGSKVEGLGAVKINGQTVSLPFTFLAALNECENTTPKTQLSPPKNLKAN